MQSYVVKLYSSIFTAVTQWPLYIAEQLFQVNGHKSEELNNNDNDDHNNNSNDNDNDSDSDSDDNNNNKNSQ